jgi:hypothetical protein
MKLDVRTGPFPIAAGIVGLALFLLVDVLFRGRAFFERDLFWIYFPVAESFVRAVAEGAFPLRDTAIGFGQPLLANPNMQVLYPPTWLHLIMAPDRAFSLIVLMHFLIGGLGAAALCWHWSRSRGASFLAGASWMVSGPFLSAVNVWHHFDGATWVPWVLLAFERLLEQPGVTRMLLLGAVFGIQGLAGSADLCIMSALLAGLRLLCEGRELTEFRVRRSILLSLGSLVVAVTLAAGIWMPAGEILRSSARSALSRAERTEWSIHPAVAVEFVFPTQIGSLPLNLESRNRLTDGRPPFLKSLFLGPLIVPLIVAGLMNTAIRFRLRLFLGLGGLLAGLGSLGRHTPVYDWLVAFIPPLGLCRYPSKGAIPLSLLAALLAAIGASSFSLDRPRRAALAAAAGTALLGGLLFFQVPWLMDGLVDPSNGAATADSIFQVRSLLLLSAVLLVLLAVSLGTGRRAFAGVVVALGVVLSVWINRDINPTVSREALAFRPPYASLFRESGLGRLYAFDYLHYPARSAQIFDRSALIVPGKLPGLDSASAFITVVRSALMAPTGGAWGIEYAWDYDLYGLHDLHLRGLSRYMREIEGQPGFLRLLQIANVTRLVALHTSPFGALLLEGSIPMPLPEPLSVFRVPGALPRAYAVSGARLLPTTEAHATILDPAFEPSREVILDAGRALPVSGSFTSVVAITTRRSDRIVLDATLNEDGHVVLVEGFLPGWHATVDGLDVPVRRANALFVAAGVPAGRHQVVFTYRPLSAVAGVALTSLSFVALLLYFGSRRGTGRA